jgi:hypothetical protein
MRTSTKVAALCQYVREFMRVLDELQEVYGQDQPSTASSLTSFVC